MLQKIAKSREDQDLLDGEYFVDSEEEYYYESEDDEPCRDEKDWLNSPSHSDDGEESDDKVNLSSSYIRAD